MSIERAKFEAWCDEYWDTSAYLHKSKTCGDWAAWRAARVRKPLSDKEIDKIAEEWEMGAFGQTELYREFLRDFAHAIELAHGIVRVA